MKRTLCLWLVASLGCASVPLAPSLGTYDEARAARLALRVQERIQCTDDQRGELRVVCAVHAVERPQPFALPDSPLSLVGVVVSVPDSGPFRVRNDFALPLLTIGASGVTLTLLYPESDREAWESDELIGQIYELMGGERAEPLDLPSDIAFEVQATLARGPSEEGFTRHATFAELGQDARIFYLESFAGHPAYAIVLQAEAEIQLAVFPVVATRTNNPEFAL